MRTATATLVAVALLAFGRMDVQAAERNRSALQVSVKVVRSCRVASDQAGVAVACSGRQPAPVQLTVDEAGVRRQAIVSGTAIPASEPSAAASSQGVRVVTIDF